MQIKRIFLGIVIAITLNSCINTIDGNGNVITKKRAVSSFNKIDVSGGFEIVLNQANKEKLELEADENLIDLIKTNVKNNTLYISSTKPIGNSKTLRLYVTTVNVNEIKASGAIELKNKGIYQVNSLEIDISGAADLDLDLNVENLTIDMSGASEINLSGIANNFEIKISGAGELQASKLKTNNTSIDVSGAGNAIVYVKKTLNIKVSGAGSIQYKGSPKIQEDISGAGSVKQI
jgi:hypothetical protein